MLCPNAVIPRLWTQSVFGVVEGVLGNIKGNKSDSNSCGSANSNGFQTSVVSKFQWFPDSGGFQSSVVSEFKWFPNSSGSQTPVVSKFQWLLDSSGLRSPVVPEFQ